MRTQQKTWEGLLRVAPRILIDVCCIVEEHYRTRRGGLTPEDRLYRAVCHRYTDPEGDGTPVAVAPGRFYVRLWGAFGTWRMSVTTRKPPSGSITLWECVILQDPVFHVDVNCVVPYKHRKYKPQLVAAYQETYGASGVETRLFREMVNLAVNMVTAY